MTHIRGKMLASVAGVVALGLAAPACADQLLTGSIASATGQKLDGVQVSAKKEGSTITTSVYTDQNGDYFFPPLADGKYRVWAQALGFHTATGSVDLTATTKHQDLKLAAIADAEERYRQLPPEMMVAGLPDATAEDANIKKVFTNACTGCHTPGYPLQFKFDEAGWNKIINLMKVVPGSGVYPGANAKVSQIIEYNRKDLAAYLARARGPGETSMKFKDRPRPTGEAARAVWTTYDLPLNPDAGIGTQGVKSADAVNDGSDWSRGVTSKLGQMPHDGGMGLDGNIYFTNNNANKLATIGKVDGKTGEVKWLKVDRADGLAATAHGLVRDGNGDFWFDVNPGRRALGKLDTKTEKISVYQTPSTMSPLGGAVTMDVDGKGKIWASAADGAVRFDPVTEQFTDFKSITPYKSPKGSGMTYGAAGDRDGNGWWAQMALDTIGRGDIASGKATEVSPAVDEGPDGPGDPEGARVLRELQRALVQHAGSVVARPAPHGHRQERRRAVGRQFLGLEPRPHRHQDDADDDHPVPGFVVPALPHRGRPEPQCVGQFVDRGPDHQVRSRQGRVDDVRPADPRHRNPPRLAARA